MPQCCHVYGVAWEIITVLDRMIGFTNPSLQLHLKLVPGNFSRGRGEIPYLAERGEQCRSELLPERKTLPTDGISPLPRLKLRGIRFSYHRYISYLQAIPRYRYLHTFQFTVAHALGFSVSTSRLLTTDITSNHHEVFLSSHTLYSSVLICTQLIFTLH
jgi:hypothetical protein